MAFSALSRGRAAWPYIPKGWGGRESGEDVIDVGGGERPEAMAVAASGEGADSEQGESEAEAQARRMQEVEAVPGRWGT